jgi:hypothetical protein
MTRTPQILSKTLTPAKTNIAAHCKPALFSKYLLATLALASALSFAPTQAVNNNYDGIHSFCNFLGSVHGLFYSRGNFNSKDEQLFQEVARSVNIDKRKVKLKNSGILWRFFGGYHNSTSSQLLNRVYINQDWFEKLPEDQKRFLFTQMLLHHRNEQGQIEFFMHWIPLPILMWLVKSITNRVISNGANPIKQYICTPMGGLVQSRVRLVFDNPNDLFNRQLIGFEPTIVVNFFALFNLYQLLAAQLSQHLESQLDHDAVTLAELDPEVGAELMKSIYQPDTKEWPWYGKLQMAVYRGIVEPIKCLPIIKQHCHSLVSYKDRVAYLRSLKGKWLETQDQYTI